MKCKDCKWLCGTLSSIGVECLQPDNKKKWDAKEQRLRDADAWYPIVVARYKHPSAPACKRFEEKGGDNK